MDQGVSSLLQVNERLPTLVHRKLLGVEGFSFSLCLLMSVFVDLTFGCDLEDLELLELRKNLAEVPLGWNPRGLTRAC